jgi:hypothetical protein
MSLATLTRLNDSHMAEIGHRQTVPLNDDGLKAWYRHDVQALLEEVLALRRDRALALGILAKNPPLEGLDPNSSLVDIANQLTQHWIDHQQGVWQRAEVKRIREKLADTANKLEAVERGAGGMSTHIRTQDEVIGQLKAQLEDAIADGQRAVASAQQACAERSRQVTELLGQAAGILA